jgi:hypothetical protein
MTTRSRGPSGPWRSGAVGSFFFACMMHLDHGGYQARICGPACTVSFLKNTYLHSLYTVKYICSILISRLLNFKPLTICFFYINLANLLPTLCFKKKKEKEILTICYFNFKKYKHHMRYHLSYGLTFVKVNKRLDLTYFKIDHQFIPE